MAKQKKEKGIKPVVKKVKIRKQKKIGKKKTVKKIKVKVKRKVIVTKLEQKSVKKIVKNLQLLEQPTTRRKKVVSFKMVEGKGPKERKSKVFSEEKMTELLEKGRQRGFVTLSELLYVFPSAERDVRGLEQLYDRFDREGIEIREVKELLQLKPKAEKKTKIAAGSK